MRLVITRRGLRLGEALHEHLQRRAHFALGRFEAALQAVYIGFRDENGPRGGVDKRCRVRVLRKRGAPILVEGAGAELATLADQTLQRAGRALARALKRGARGESFGGRGLFADDNKNAYHDGRGRDQARAVRDT